MTTVPVTELPVTRRVEHVMGMPISLALRGAAAGTARADLAWRSALAELRRVDEVFSTWRDDSFISRLGRGEIGVADCPPEVAEVLALAEQARIESHGAFDVRRPAPGGRVVLDPSGIVKGWAVERAARFFDDLEDTDLCLSAGGDLVCRTRIAGSVGWRIGIEDPHDPSRTVAVVPVQNGAVATSGFTHRGEHISDPRTGVIPSDLAQVTVVGADLTGVDVDATAAFVMGHDARAWLESRGRTGLLVSGDGEVTVFGSARHP